MSTGGLCMQKTWSQKNLPLFLKEKASIVGQAKHVQKPTIIAKEISRPASTVYCVLAQKDKIIAVWQTGKALLASPVMLAKTGSCAVACWSGFLKHEVGTAYMKGILGMHGMCGVPIST